ncbi:unnamed protein product [Hymenolepis diminuta]|uniref:Vacuolar protein sorting-associated protein 26 n=1 Tax=Hymenolepis diminuta TaxID=6216 RepID=A0A564Z583_HYMDI|nr:unnamed protein product [Hymenolepis diminuta]
MNLFGIGQSASIDISLNNLSNRKLIEAKLDQNQTCLLPVFYNGETISGKVTISLKRGSKLEYQAIKIELIGHIDFFADRGSRDEFLNQTQDLARPGILSQASTTYPFQFDNVEMPYESYSGSNVHLRYFLRVTVVKRFMDLTKELDFLVHSFYKPQHPDTNIQMEVGIEESLHIEFEYNKSCYHLEDVIVGKIYFQLVRVKIKYMEVQILRRESTGLGAVNTFTELETMAKFEIMDGAPVRGECIPIRLFLGAYEQLTPTAKDVNRKFSVRYYINLVLLDEEERRYYKQHEIFLYRRPDKRYEAFMQNQQTSTMIALKNFSMHPQNYLNASSRPAATVTAQSVSAPSSTSEEKDVGRLSVPQSEKEGQEHMANPSEQENGETGSAGNAQSSDANGAMEGPSETKEHDQAQAENGVENPDDTLSLEGEEKDVFSGLSDQDEDNTEGRISREQRSFARYESPRDAVIEESERERSGDGSEVTINKPSMETFESASSPSTTKVSPETTPAIS